MKINNSELIQVDTLKPYHHNVKEHPKSQISDLKTMMSDPKIGYTYPIIVDENNTILAGHGRVQAMKELGETNIPCFRMEGLTESEKAQIMIYDNEVANTPWNYENFKVVFNTIDIKESEKFNFDFTNMMDANTKPDPQEWDNYFDNDVVDPDTLNRQITFSLPIHELDELKNVLGGIDKDKEVALMALVEKWKKSS